MCKINNAGNISSEKSKEKLIKELNKPPLKRWSLGSTLKGCIIKSYYVLVLKPLQFFEMQTITSSSK